MKKTQLIERLNEILTIADMEAEGVAAEIRAFIDELDTAAVEDKGKLTYFIRVHEQTLDPAMKYPKQMLECYQIIAELEKPELTLKEIQDAIGVSAERLGTRQDPYRIYTFYQKRMADEGWIERDKARI
jgi:hypothetical protein